MKKSDLRKLAQKPDLIPGIYNYCDRWCERCPFTHRCMQYAMEQEQRRQRGRSPRNHDAFWKNLEASLKRTEGLLAELAAEHGLKLDQREPGTLQRQRRSKRQAAERHPLAMASKKYSALVDEWFQNGEAVLRDKEEEILAQAKLGVGGVNEEIASLTDVVEILRWYQYQIYPKVMRGLSAEPAHGDNAGFPRDSDGSVKVALIAMDRSIAAWMRMKDFFPAQGDDILNLLLHLDRLRRDTEKEFPNARRFVRPGFDTEEAPG